MNRETNEQWRPVEGFQRYMVSNKGRVKSFTSKTHPEGKLAKITRNKKGYQIVHITTGENRSSANTTTTRFVHRLVAEAFIPVPRELRRYGKKALQVDHILPVSMGGGILNEDGTFNLRWVTSKQNSNNELTLQNLKNAKKKKSEPRLRIIPLGGMGEIGKNMTAYEYGGEIIVVDCGMAFPGDDMYGIDLVIPVAQLIVVVVQTFCSLVKVALCVSVRGDNLKKLFCFIY